MRLVVHLIMQYPPEANKAFLFALAHAKYTYM